MCNLEEALKEQIKYCNELDRYRCGIYIKKSEDRKCIFDKIVEITSNSDSIDKMFNNSYSTSICFKNGSCINITSVSDNVRGQRNNGVIIDNKIDKNVIDCVIMRTLMLRWINEYERERWEEVKQRIIYCEI